MMQLHSWLYFGCHEESGHYLWEPGMLRARGDRVTLVKLEHFDGMLAPPRLSEPYIAAITRLGGFGATALSFWDDSLDNRPGGNSTFFAPSPTVSAEGMLAGAQRFFPQVIARLPVPIRLLDGQP